MEKRLYFDTVAELYESSRPVPLSLDRRPAMAIQDLGRRPHSGRGLRDRQIDRALCPAGFQGVRSRPWSQHARFVQEEVPQVS